MMKMETTNRELLVELGLENSVVFENPDYDSAIVGWDVNSERIVYDYNMMIEHLMEKDGMDYEEAQEFIDYNTVRACPYMGDKAPIILSSLESYQ